ncbi:peptidase M23 [Erythrobacter sp. HI0019]|nr:peptidase M23 [Erythrobacter sp. HI0019]KZY02283.1 peptidase M23 [Erythrobacter sp. HI0028]
MRSWFPDREFFMRSEGQVRFITISSKVQMMAAALALAALVVCAASVAIAGWTQYRAETERLSLRDREARVATAEERVDAYGADIAAVKDDLNRRMEFLEAMGEALPEDLKAFSSVSDSASEAAETVEKVSAAFPEAAELARIEARQLALVEGLTHYADWRAQRAAAALEKLGLDSASMIRTAERGAMGGPFENLATEADGSIDPRFVRLGLSIARMDALERGLAGVPQVTPAHKDMISSGFGFRRDPFNGGGAMHKGLDFRGAIGTPISAASDGRVSFVGRKGGYGKTVEITHGNGLMTRYAHMSRFNAKVGQRVAAGETIGAIGNTGRSTGPHLHFEVRINNRAVNPRTFLETAPDVLEEIRRSPNPARTK